MATLSTSFLPIRRSRLSSGRSRWIASIANRSTSLRSLHDGTWKVLPKLNGSKLPKLQNVARESLPSVRVGKLTDFEICNLIDHFHESNDLSETQPEFTRRLRSKLERHFRASVDPSHVWSVLAARCAAEGSFKFCWAVCRNCIASSGVIVLMSNDWTSSNSG